MDSEKITVNGEQLRNCSSFASLGMGERPARQRSCGTHDPTKSSISAIVHCSLLIVPSSLLATTAGSATAQDIALRGGMSLIDGTFITACLMGIAAIISACGGVVWANRRNARKRPLDSDDTYVTHGECKSHRCALEKRIDELGPALNRIFSKLAENDKKSEERANQMHRRIDPLIERTAANTQAIEMFKDFARKSTVGGEP